MLLCFYWTKGSAPFWLIKASVAFEFLEFLWKGLSEVMLIVWCFVKSFAYLVSATAAVNYCYCCYIVSEESFWPVLDVLTATFLFLCIYRTQGVLCLLMAAETLDVSIEAFCEATIITYSVFLLVLSMTTELLKLSFFGSLFLGSFAAFLVLSLPTSLSKSEFGWWACWVWAAGECFELIILLWWLVSPDSCFML